MAITLNSGFKMPIVGLGVWRMEGKEIKDLILNAIKIGYRHFDCAGTSLYFGFFFFFEFIIWFCKCFDVDAWSFFFSVLRDIFLVIRNQFF